MPRTRECDYCGDDIDPGTGTMLVRTDGTTFQFCSSKCERNHDLGREPRDAEWTEEGRRAGGPGAEETSEPEAESEPESEAEPEPEAESASEPEQAIDEIEAGDDETEGTDADDEGDDDEEVEE